MIAFGRREEFCHSINLSAIPSSMGLFGGRPAQHVVLGQAMFASISIRGSKRASPWVLPRAPGGNPVLLSGWIDNRDKLRSQLGLSNRCDAEIYGAAVDRWGDDADRHIIGTYASIVELQDGTVRMARSPWVSKSLFYYHDKNTLLACSIPRPIFAAGVPKRLRQEAIDALLTMDLPDDTESSFAEVWTVPQGSVVSVNGRKTHTYRWYDPLDFPKIRFSRDEDYIAAANAMLAEAVGKVVGLDGKFGIALSGGLDSSMVTDELLRQFPAGRRLKSYTRHPLSEWDGRVAPHKFGDDKPWVEAFAAMHPALDPSFDDNHGRDFDDHAEHMFMAGDAGYPARMVYARFHGIMDAARRDGCDWLLTADMGNMTFSNSAPWAYAEFFRKGKIRQLWQLLANHIDDPRPMWRRLLALGLMPQLPQSLQHRIRELVHSDREVDRFANPFLNRNGRLAEFVRESAIRSNIMTVDRLESRENYIRSNYHAAGLGIESCHSYEQVFGVSIRDVTAYRPLIEFCFGLPTEQFARHGQTRWLARQMGKGRMPEAQRTNRLYGEQNVDWHARLKPRLKELRKEVEALERNPEIGPLVDTDRMLDAIDNFPDVKPADPDFENRLRFFLPSVLYISRYVNWVTGNNQI